MSSAKTRQERGEFRNLTNLFAPTSRPASSMGISLLPEGRLPQRLSTPTCPGSKSSFSVFDCELGCFIEPLPEEGGANEGEGSR